FVSAPSHGSLDLNGNGSFSYVPDANYFGSDSFSYFASNGVELSNLATVSIEINSVDDPPDLSISAPSTATEDVEYSASASATDPVEGDSITISIVRGPLGMTIDASGDISWTPRNSQVGVNTVVLRATDAGGAFDERSFTVTVANVNNAPIILSQPIVRG